MALNKKEEDSSLDFEEDCVSIAAPDVDANAAPGFSSQKEAEDASKTEKVDYLEVANSGTEPEPETEMKIDVGIPEAIPIPASVAPHFSGVTEDYSFAPSKSESENENENVNSESTTAHCHKKSSTTNGRQVGAALVIAVVVLPLLGPILATAAGVAAAYGSTQPGTAGDACRAAGDVAILAKEKAVEVNEKHNVVNKTTEGAQGVIAKLKDVNAYEILEKIKFVLENTFRHLGEALKFAARKMKKNRTSQEEDSDWDLDIPGADAASVDASVTSFSK